MSNRYSVALTLTVVQAVVSGLNSKNAAETYLVMREDVCNRIVHRERKEGRYLGP
jgi:hypothetical protein